MMNLFKLSEQLKDLSKDQLVQEMRMPSGAVPQYLILSELQRRTRMEREAMSGEGAQPTTVAEDAVAAAGVPQAGLAGMARAMAPRTDMTENSGIAAMAPQMPVERMQEGGAVGPNTARLRDLMELQRALEQARVQTDVNRQRVLRAGRDVAPGIGAIPSRVTDFLDRDVTPVDEFGGLPPSMTDPGVVNVADVEPRVSDVEVAPTGSRGDRAATRRTRFEEGPGSVNPFEPIVELLDRPPGEPPSMDERRRRGDYMDTGTPLYEQDLDWLLPGEIPEEGRRGRPPRNQGPSPEMLDAARRFEEEAEAADREIAALPGGIAPVIPGLETPRDAGPAAPGAPGGAGGPDLDRLYEQDRWLALARFGLGLMSSTQPTFGGAIGEAGAGALDYMAGARESMLDRRMQEREMALQERALALRAAGTGEDSRGYGARDLLGVYQEQLSELDAQLAELSTYMLGDEVPPAIAQQYSNLTDRRAQIAAALSALGVSGFGPATQRLVETDLTR